MTFAPCRTDDLGGGVTGPRRSSETLMRGRTADSRGRQVCITWMRAYDAAGRGRHEQLAWRGAMFDTEDVGVFLGLDVGKSAHHGHGLTPAGKKVFDKQLPNSEPKLRAVFDKLAAKFGTVLVIVDQPASIGALPADRRPRRGLPGRLPARTGDAPDRRPLPGRGQDRRQGRAVIADAARTMPHTLRSLELDRRDHRRADRARRLRPGPRGRGHPHLQPDTRPAHPVPPHPGTRPGPPPGPPGRHLAAGALRLPGRTAQSRPPPARRAASGPRPRAWPSG